MILFMIGHSLGRVETCDTVHDRAQPWAYGDVFWPRHPRCGDPISKHISNPEFACKPFSKKKGGVVFEIGERRSAAANKHINNNKVVQGILGQYLTPYKT